MQYLGLISRQLEAVENAIKCGPASRLPVVNLCFSITPSACLVHDEFLISRARLWRASADIEFHSYTHRPRHDFHFDIFHTFSVHG